MNSQDLSPHIENTGEPLASWQHFEDILVIKGKLYSFISRSVSFCSPFRVSKMITKESDAISFPEIPPAVFVKFGGGILHHKVDKINAKSVSIVVSSCHPTWPLESVLI